MRKHKRLNSVKSRIIALMLLCWFLPLVLLAGFNVHYLTSDHLQSNISKEVGRLKFTANDAVENLQGVIDASLAASYDGRLLRNYYSFLGDRMSQHELLSEASTFLRENCQSNDIDVALLWYWKNPQKLYCNTYNSSNGVTYADVRDYWRDDFRPVERLAKTIGTEGHFLRCGDQLYYVRNLCNSKYTPVATIALQINQENCFNAYTTFPEGTSVTLRLDGVQIPVLGEIVTSKETGLTEMGGQSGYRWRGGELRLYNKEGVDDHNLTSLVRIEGNSAFSPFHGYGWIFFLMVLLLVPLLALLFWVFHRYVAVPMRSLMDGAEAIQKGDLGYQLEGEPESEEFQYLSDSFNAMSSRLKYQFQHIYEEELALRDARIKALQSQINPHFMNNTLEIINWEARFAGNDKVSRMIEALATLMNAGIDRNMRPEIPLSEEMIYVNAYLYITSQRLGDRLTILNEFPEEIMNCMVPRLILQPVIENAVEHGAARSGQGSVLLYGYQEGEYLYLEITNESHLDQEDLDKIARLLAPGYDTSREPSLNLGIANVNQRLRILYGEGSGLSVEQVDPGHVCSRLTIHLRQEDGKK